MFVMAIIHPGFSLQSVDYRNREEFNREIETKTVYVRVLYGEKEGSIGKLGQCTRAYNSYSKAFYVLCDGKRAFQAKANNLTIVSNYNGPTVYKKKEKVKVVHKDMLGRDIVQGAFVAYSSASYGMVIGNITKIGETGSLTITPLKGGKAKYNRWHSGFSKTQRVTHPSDVLILDSETFSNIMMIKLSKEQF